MCRRLRGVRVAWRESTENSMARMGLWRLSLSICKFVGVSMFFSGSAWAVNTPYQPVTELKAWDTKTDVYHTATHSCGGSDARRYHVAPDRVNHIQLLLAAFLSGKRVSLAYTCSGDYPFISGVRVR